MPFMYKKYVYVLIKIHIDRDFIHFCLSQSLNFLQAKTVKTCQTLNPTVSLCPRFIGPYYVSNVQLVHTKRDNTEVKKWVWACVCVVGGCQCADRDSEWKGRNQIRCRLEIGDLLVCVHVCVRVVWWAVVATRYHGPFQSLHWLLKRNNIRGIQLRKPLSHLGGIRSKLAVSTMCAHS